MNFIKRIWADIKNGENVDLYITIVVSIVLVILNLFGISSVNYVSTATLAILALIAISILQSRNQMQKFVEKVITANDGTLSEKFPDDMYLNIENAKEVWFVGVSMLSNFQEHYQLIERKIASGDNIKVLLVDPDSPACKMAAIRDVIVNNAYEQSRIKAALRYMSTLKRKNPKKVEIRVIDDPLEFEVIYANSNLIRRTMYIRHFGFKTPPGSEPKLVVRSQNAKWLNYFILHFENMWKESKEWIEED